MKQWLANPLLQLALCVGLYAALGYWFGKFAIVTASPVFAYAITRPLFALAAAFRNKAHADALMPLSGKHFAYKDATIRVEEDDDHCRWVCLADVHRVLGETASERALAVTYPGRVKAMGQPAQAHVRDDALIAHLSKRNEAHALRFRTWAERTIALPGRRIRRDLGIHVDDAVEADTPPAPTGTAAR